MEYRRRVLDDVLNSYMKAFGAVLIKGPKGSGKTTTAKQKAKTIIEFQDEDVRDNYLLIANTVPSKLLVGEKPILFDEWQDAPKIWGAIRKDVDDSGKVGQYILTGSSSESVTVHHSGALRIGQMTMYPMSLFESGESNGSVSLMDLFDAPDSFDSCSSDLAIDDLIFAICRGGWPASMSRDSEASLLIARSLYTETIQTDISRIDGVKRNPQIAKALLGSYSRNICTPATINSIVGDIKANNAVSDTSIYSYIEALEKLYIIDDIDAWCPAIRSKTAIRSSRKRNLIDPSLAVAAMGLSPDYFDKDFKTLGFLFESLCIRDLKIYSSKYNGQVSYYRDRYGLEADAVLHLDDGRYALIEFKLGQNGVDDGAKHLLKIEELVAEHNKEEKQCPIRLPDLKIIITATKFGYRREDGVFVIPIGCLRD